MTLVLMTDYMRLLKKRLSDNLSRSVSRQSHWIKVTVLVRSTQDILDPAVFWNGGRSTTLYNVAIANYSRRILDTWKCLEYISPLDVFPRAPVVPRTLKGEGAYQLNAAVCLAFLAYKGLNAAILVSEKPFDAKDTRHFGFCYLFDWRTV